MIKPAPKTKATNVAMDRVKSYVDRLEKMEEKRKAIGGEGSRPRCGVHTYIIRAGIGGPVKIGSARNVHARCGELQTGNHEELRIVRIIAGNVENALHRHFRAEHIRGEWFRFLPEMLTFLPQIQEDELLAEYRRALDMPTPPAPTTIYLAGDA